MEIAKMVLSCLRCCKPDRTSVLSHKVNVFISYVCMYFYLIKFVTFFFPFFLFILLLPVIPGE